MTRVRAWTIPLVCTALITGPTLGPASAFGATGRLSLAKPPWLVSTERPNGSGSTTPGSGTLPQTGADAPDILLTAMLLLGVGGALRVRGVRSRG
jgi:LPXTG-motif cell wall-anchored protein